VFGRRYFSWTPRIYIYLQYALIHSPYDTCAYHFLHMGKNENGRPFLIALPPLLHILLLGTPKPFFHDFLSLWTLTHISFSSRDSPHTFSRVSNILYTHTGSLELISYYFSDIISKYINLSIGESLTPNWRPPDLAIVLQEPRCRTRN
jgi:hypothetical protein